MAQVSANTALTNPGRVPNKSSQTSHIRRGRQNRNICTNRTDATQGCKHKGTIAQMADIVNVTLRVPMVYIITLLLYTAHKSVATHSMYTLCMHSVNAMYATYAIYTVWAMYVTHASVCKATQCAPCLQ